MNEKKVIKIPNSLLDEDEVLSLPFYYSQVEACQKLLKVHLYNMKIDPKLITRNDHASNDTILDCYSPDLNFRLCFYYQGHYFPRLSADMLDDRMLELGREIFGLEPDYLGFDQDLGQSSAEYLLWPPLEYPGLLERWAGQNRVYCWPNKIKRLMLSLSLLAETGPGPPRQ